MSENYDGANDCDDENDYYESLLHYGPSHYEGWTCKGCEYLIYKLSRFSYCVSKFKNDMGILEEHRIVDIMHTPPWCPHLKHAIMQHVLDNR